MRKMLAIFAALFTTTMVGIFLGPGRTIFFPAPLTKNQRAIISRAEAGLHLYATKSPTAAKFYREVREDSWWARTPLVFSSPSETSYAVSVMSGNPLKLVAFYLHPTRSICFVEEACDSLGHLALGLTYPHELQHRRDFRDGLVHNSDLPNSLPVRQSEARAELVELTILNEFTEGRWQTTVEQHLQQYTKQSAVVRRRHPLGKRLFDIDLAWMKKEFGQAGMHDIVTLRAHFLFAVQYHQQVKNKSLTKVDSLEVATRLFKKP